MEPECSSPCSEELAIFPFLNHKNLVHPPPSDHNCVIHLCGVNRVHIIKELSSKQHSKAEIQGLTIDSKYLKDQQVTADAFNNYFLSNW